MTRSAFLAAYRAELVANHKKGDQPDYVRRIMEMCLAFLMGKARNGEPKDATSNGRGKPLVGSTDRRSNN